MVAVVHRVGMSGTINDLRTFRLGELSEEQADALLRKLGRGEGLELADPIRRRILERITWRIPYHLQLIFDQLLRWSKFEGRAFGVELVDEAFEALLGPESRKHFAHWEERITDPLIAPQERDLMRALLAAAAKDERGFRKDTAAQLRRKVAPEEDLAPVLLSLGRPRRGPGDPRRPRQDQEAAPPDGRQPAHRGPPLRCARLGACSSTCGKRSGRPKPPVREASTHHLKRAHVDLAKAPAQAGALG